MKNYFKFGAKTIPGPKYKRKYLINQKQNIN